MPTTPVSTPVLYELRSGVVAATVSSRGGALVGASVDGVAIVEPTATTHAGPGAAGLVLAPWVNRVEGAQWEADGIRHRLEVTEPATGHAIHGLLAPRDLEPRERGPARIVLGCLIDGAPGYPYRVDVEVAYTALADGIRVQISAVNTSDTAAPFAAGHHPYLRIGDVPTADLLLSIDGDVELGFDDTYIPRTRHDVAGTEADLRAGVRIGDGDRHACYEASGPPRTLVHRLEAPGGERLEVRADARLNRTQIYVAPALPTDDGPRRAIAIEPMSAPANALRMGDGLDWIAPGDRWSAGFDIRLGREAPGGRPVPYDEAVPTHRRSAMVPGLSIRPSIGAAEYPDLVAIWRSAVDATHGFLAERDRDEIEAHLPSDYFPAVMLSVAELDGRPVGFSGVLDGNLEMLFVDAAQRGSGIGTALLAQAIGEHGVTAVDVNEQNEQATRYYLRRGFEVVGRSETDDAGRPYPLLHLRLSAS